jgi:acetyl/propionyl-CoA carboxylase alpha subunit
MPFPTFYDPMIAKVIAWGEDRTAAAQRLRRALMETEIAGLATNTAFLIDVLGHPAFLREEIDTASSSVIAPTCCRKARVPRTGRSLWRRRSWC